MAVGKCPACKMVIPNVRLDTVTVNAPGNTWHGVTYLCPLCMTILSVAIDPVALEDNTVKDIVKQLRR